MLQALVALLAFMSGYTTCVAQVFSYSDPWGSDPYLNEQYPFEVYQWGDSTEGFNRFDTEYAYDPYDFDRDYDHDYYVHAYDYEIDYDYPGGYVQEEADARDVDWADPYAYGYDYSPYFDRLEDVYGYD
ncbi:MAG TPA: hypothetical protein VF175_04595 [Lacipirellula sp.]